MESVQLCNNFYVVAFWIETMNRIDGLLSSAIYNICRSTKRSWVGCKQNYLEKKTHAMWIY